MSSDPVPLTLPGWGIYKGDGTSHAGLAELPAAPPWRPFAQGRKPDAPPTLLEDDSLWAPDKARAQSFVVTPEMRHAVNAALYLRRPLLLTGKPGTGKSSLIDSVAYELRMGKVLRWAITSRSTLKSGLYEYDALARLNAGEKAPVGDFVTLGPLGTALLPRAWPRALLIDEIDKSDLDLPNDLLNLFERGEYGIPELTRLAKRESNPIVNTADGLTEPIPNGTVQCGQFPFVILTSNGEREFPAPFLRRCIRLKIKDPNVTQLSAIVFSHLQDLESREREAVMAAVGNFLDRQKGGDLATDQLLNAIFMTIDLPGRPRDAKSMTEAERKWLIETLLSHLSASATPESADSLEEGEPPS